MDSGPTFYHNNLDSTLTGSKTLFEYQKRLSGAFAALFVI